MTSAAPAAPADSQHRVAPQLRSDLQRLERPAAWADQIKAALLWLYQHPQWPAAVLVLLLILKPKRALSWSGRLWWLWKSTPLRRLRVTLTVFRAALMKLPKPWLSTPQPIWPAKRLSVTQP